MLKGYWIPHLDVSNPEGFQAYRTMADAAHARHGSKLLARGGRREVVEGNMRSRNVLREFNSYDEAQAFYHGPEYSRAHPLREPHSVCDFVIVEGYDGPQPERIGTPPAAAALKGYWIGGVDVTDPEGYATYAAATPGLAARFGGRFIVRGGRFEAKEGAARTRNVVIEFPDYAAAVACYRSPEYQQNMKIRQANALTDLIIVEGYDGPQP